MNKKVKFLEQSLDELNATHEKLGKAHSKLKKAHSSLIEQVKVEEAKKEQVIVSCDVGLTCDLIDESFHEPIIVAPTNTYCSTTISTPSINDASLKVENETLKKEVNELTRALGNAYGGDAHLLKCLEPKVSLNKEGLGYTPKNDKAAFVTL